MKGNKIIELQVGFHVDKLRRYQRIITNEYFDEYLFEHQDYNDGMYNISKMLNLTMNLIVCVQPLGLMKLLVNGN